MNMQDSITVTELAQLCAGAMERYRRRQRYDPRYCYELFRLALMQQNEEAWDAVYNQYHRLVGSWMSDPSGDLDALVNEVFTRFWQAVSPDSFEFSTLGKILAYLKRCAWAVVTDSRRRWGREQVTEIELARARELEIRGGKGLSLEKVLGEILGEELYERAMECLNSPKEQLIFRASIEWNMAPREIAEEWPNSFSSAQEVSRIKERMFRRLRRDETLKQLLGIDVEDSGETER